MEKTDKPARKGETKLEHWRSARRTGGQVRYGVAPGTVQVFYDDSGNKYRMVGLPERVPEGELRERDMARLLEYLAHAYGSAEPVNKITLTRRQTSEIKKAGKGAIGRSTGVPAGRLMMINVPSTRKVETGGEFSAAQLEYLRKEIAETNVFLDNLNSKITETTAKFVAKANQDLKAVKDSLAKNKIVVS